MKRIILSMLLVILGFVLCTLTYRVPQFGARSVVLDKMDQFEHEYGDWIMNTVPRVEKSHVSFLSPDGKVAMFILTMSAQGRDLINRLDYPDAIIHYHMNENEDIIHINDKHGLVSISVKDGQFTLLSYDTREGQVAIDKNMDGVIDILMDKNGGAMRDDEAEGVTH